MSQRIGDFLISIKAMTVGQVDEVLRIQREGEEPRMFGEIAIELGYIDDEALKKYVEQKGEGASA